MAQKRRRDDRRFGRRKVHRVPSAQYTDLDEYIDKTHDTLEGIAERVGSTASYISRIRNGWCCPRPRLAARIAKYAGVPIDSFAKTWLRRQSLKRSA